MEIIDKNKTSYPRRSKGGIIFALILIALGILFLGSNAGHVLASYKPIIFTWPMLIIVIGLISFINSSHFSLDSLMVMTVGFFFLIPKIGANDMNLFGWQIPDNFVSHYWALLLVVAGVFMLIKWMLPDRFKKHSCCGKKRTKHIYEKFNDKIEENKIFSVFGSGKHTILEQDFKGGEVNVVFGEAVLDFRKAGLQEGTTHLKVNVAFGGVTITLPRDWNVEIRSYPILAGIDDKRTPDSSAIDYSKKLVITCSCAFAGCEIRD